MTTAVAALAIENLCVDLGGKRVVANMSLEVRPEECVGLIGPNGSGKSSALRAVAGLIRSASGRVVIDGRPLDTWSRMERARYLAYLAQERVIGWDLAVKHVVALGRIPFGDRNSAEAQAAVTEALAATGTTDLADRSVQSLSGGERARVLLARSLAGRPRILLADEPTAALDPRYQLAAMRTLREAAARGAAVLVVLHDLTLAARACDRVAIMTGGRVVAFGSPAEAMTRERMSQVFGVEIYEGTIEANRVLVPWRESKTPTRSNLQSME